MPDQQKCFTEEYVARVVHDLKTPVLAIGGYAKRLREGKQGPLNEEQKRTLDIILRTAERLEHDLGWIVEHAKAGKFVWEQARPERFDLGEHVSEVAEAIRALAGKRRIGLKVDLPDRALEVEADPRMIDRAVSELIHNALKHSFEKGTVTVSLAETDDRKAELVVTDHGEGFDPDKLQLVFQPWEDVMQIEDRKIRGMGLGLANVKRYAEAHGGDVLAETAPGRGSTFRLLLPLAGNDRDSAGS